MGAPLRTAKVVAAATAVLVLVLVPMPVLAQVRASSGSGLTITASLIPLINNEDGTYYPGDSFSINYSVGVGEGGTYYDRNGRPCAYYYTFEYTSVEGEHIGGGTSPSPQGAINCTVSLDAPPGPTGVEVVAHGSYHYQYWVNETYPIYENGTLVGYGWQWASYWASCPVEASAHFEVEVVEYDPHFTLALYPILKGDAETTYEMDLALLVRYDGNGPSLSLRQRAVVDCYSSRAVGTAFFFAAPEEIPQLVMKGFTLRPATAEDLAAQEDLNAGALQLINATHLLSSLLSGAQGQLYVGTRECPEYGPSAANLTYTLFDSGMRYARYVFSPGSPQTAEGLGIGNLDVNITLSWSRFPSEGRTASVGLPYLKVREPLTIKTVALTPAGAEPVTAQINATATIGEGDVLFTALFQPPEAASEPGEAPSGGGGGGGSGVGSEGGGEGGGGDEWFAQQWAADSVVGAGAVECSAVGTSAKLLVPRTATCHYVLSVSASAPASDSAPPPCDTCADACGWTNATTISGWVPLYVDFDQQACEVVVNVGPDPGTSVINFADHLSYVEMRIATSRSTLRAATVFSPLQGAGSGSEPGSEHGSEPGAGSGPTPAEGGGGGRLVWKTVSWNPKYGGGGGEVYDLWAEKPRSLTSGATAVYVEVTDVWGNVRVLEAGTVGPYAEGFCDIPYSGLFTVALMVVGALVLYELLQKIASRL